MINIKLKDDNNFADWDVLIKNSGVSTFFQSSAWIKIWLKHFGGKSLIYNVYENNGLVGIIPLIKQKDKVSLMGASPVLGKELVGDYGDIIVKNSFEKIVWTEFLTKIKDTKVVLDFIREDSPSYPILKVLGGQEEQVDVAPLIVLPSTWEAYLATLDRHNRHELKRKIRRLEEDEVIKSCFSGDGKEISEFFRLMALSNEQKRDFLSPDMKKFFEDIIKTFAESGELEMCFLKKEDIYIAAVLVFHYNNEVLLYNSGFDPAYSYLSPGLILKAYMIRKAIEDKKARFDFLRGGERYKYDLGAKERKLYRITF